MHISSHMLYIYTNQRSAIITEYSLPDLTVLIFPLCSLLVTPPAPTLRSQSSEPRDPKLHKHWIKFREKDWHWTAADSAETLPVYSARHDPNLTEYFNRPDVQVMLKERGLLKEGLELMDEGEYAAYLNIQDRERREKQKEEEIKFHDAQFEFERSIVRERLQRELIEKQDKVARRRVSARDRPARASLPPYSSPLSLLSHRHHHHHHHHHHLSLYTSLHDILSRASE
eukprot:TRINITY_DN17687_c0_g1_i1.p1 TRINITY_DN17687_c0_g1~~TRINITY_DN17687_c0_g1_i1.p1  ORF type:complete len:228 (-),score=26.12 TRINITY_DN17687_c0_g1_i1:93-776(-)